jgi:DNA replication protein DnaC
MSSDVKIPVTESQFGSSQEHCERHGPYTAEKMRIQGFPDLGDYKSPCPVCDDEETERRQREERDRAAAATARQLASRRERAGLPRRHFESSFDNFTATNDEHKRALHTAEGFANNFLSVLQAGSCLIFSGGVGTGKTHLACAIANQLLGSFGVIYTTGYALVRSIRGAWRNDSTVSETEVVNKYSTVQLLIIDEIGAQFGSEGERVQLFDILNARYDRVLPTIIITNLTMQELRECIGERSYDRLTEIGGSVLTLTGESYRRNEELLGRRMPGTDPS